jgi:hypothetical protein
MFHNVYQNKASGKQFVGTLGMPSRKLSDAIRSDKAPHSGIRLVGRLSVRFKDAARG